MYNFFVYDNRLEVERFCSVKYLRRTAVKKYPARIFDTFLLILFWTRLISRIENKRLHGTRQQIYYIGRMMRNASFGSIPRQSGFFRMVG